jgi:hypothetical protein
VYIYIQATRQALHSHDLPQYATSEATSVHISGALATSTAAASTATVGPAASAYTELEHNDDGCLTDDDGQSIGVRSVKSEHSNSSSSSGNKSSNVLGSPLIIEIADQHCEDQHSSTHTPVISAATASAAATAVESATEEDFTTPNNSTSASTAATGADAVPPTDDQLAAAAVAAQQAAEQEAAWRRAVLWPAVEVCLHATLV